MKICFVWDGDYPWDVRVEKIGNTLASFGHEVHLVCRNEKRRGRVEKIGSIHVHRLPAVGVGSSSRFLGALNDMMNVPLFFNPIWVSRSLQVAKRIDADVVLVRDLPLALTAVAVGRVLGIPVVMDMAEDYPEQLRGNWRNLKRFKLRNVFLRNPWLAKHYEKLAIRLIDHIIVVVDESKARLEGLGVPAERITIVSNTPSLNGHALGVKAERTDNLGLRDSSFRIGYVGLLDNERGLEVAIKAMPKIVNALPDATLIIAGSGNYERELKSLTRDLGLEEHVAFLGWVEPTTAGLLISDCDIGIVPHHSVPSWNNTIPNKLFDYMMRGEPVLVSSATAQARIVTEEGCGLVFEDRNEWCFAEQAIRLADGELRRSFGLSGQRAVLEKFNWNVASRNLHRLFVDIARG